MRMHILQAAGNNVYDVVVHAATPAGNNSAGITWKAALAGSGLNVTTLPIGNGVGQITTAEANQVSSGDLIEARFQWGDDPTWDNATRTADLNVRAQQAVDQTIAEYGRRLKFFGHTVA